MAKKEASLFFAHLDAVAAAIENSCRSTRWTSAAEGSLCHFEARQARGHHISSGLEGAEGETWNGRTPKVRKDPR